MEQITTPAKGLISLIIDYISNDDNRQQNLEQINEKVTEIEQVLYDKAPGQRKGLP